jgi:hypothetical protein
MAFDKTNKGTLRKNDKRTEDWHPHYRGDLNVEGAEYWLDATLKEWPDGTKYMSLKLRPKSPATDNMPRVNAPASKPARPVAQPSRSLKDELDDDLPIF